MQCIQYIIMVMLVNLMYWNNFISHHWLDVFNIFYGNLGKPDVLEQFYSHHWLDAMYSIFLE